MDRQHALSALEGRLGYVFTDRSLLERALCHRSWVEERYPGGKAPAHESQETLECLGDALLDLVVARWLYDQTPTISEGDLTRERARYAGGAWLTARGEELGLRELIRFGRGAAEQLSSNKSVIENTVEALLGAMAVDGGEAAATSLLRGWMASRPAGPVTFVNPTGAFGEWYQKRYKQSPPAPTCESTGPDHARQWTCSVEVEGQTILGTGDSKKSATAAAYAAALEHLGVLP
jgi:dsRNA-specific ribonuclease